MIASRPDEPRPRPVPVGKYRYTRLRWRVLVRLLDALGVLIMTAWRLIRPIRRIERPRRILIVQLDHMGDAVLSSPMFPRLRAAYPDARIDVLASPSGQPVFAAIPQIDRVILAERNWFERRPGGWALGSAVWALGRRLRGERYDLGIDVRGDVLTVLVLTLAGIPRRLGWAMGGGGFLLTDVVSWVPGRHEVDSRLALLGALGLTDDDAPARVEVPATDVDRSRVARLLREAWDNEVGTSRRSSRRAVVTANARSSSHPRISPGAGRARESASSAWDDPDWLHAGRFGDEAPLLAVHLGAGTAAKRWPARHWRRLLDRFLADGWRVVVLGGPEDHEAATSVGPHPALRDWTDRLTITEAVALLERADLFVGADSGPAHLAACAGTTSVILFSGTNLVRQWRPRSRRSLALRRSVACRPCHRKACPLVDHPCMTGLDPDRVYRAARRWWARIQHAETPHAPL